MFSCEKFLHFLNLPGKGPTSEKCCFTMWDILAILWAALKPGSLLGRLHVCMWNQSVLLAMGSRPAHTGKPQAALKKSHGWKMNLIISMVLTATPGREIFGWPAVTAPFAMKRSGMLINHCIFLHFGRRKQFFTPYFLFSWLSHALVFFMLLSKGPPTVAGTQVAALCIARATRCEGCENPSEMVSPHRSAWKNSRCVYSLIHKSCLRTFLW